MLFGKLQSSRPVVLMILDGWGVAPDSDGNALTRAKTPHLDKYIRTYPAMTLVSSGVEVGLSWGEMGNSEVGHLNIGAGRVYYQTFPRINKDIEDGTFFENSAFLKATAHAKDRKSHLHIIGIISEGNVHGASSHVYALLELAKKQGIKEVFVHAILDGRDALYNSGRSFIEKLQKKIEEIGVGRIASLSGRFYAMDRDNRWDRIEKSYRAMTADNKDTTVPTHENPLAAIDASYTKEVYDEEFVPIAIVAQGVPVGSIKDGDAIIFANFRPDRARELTHAFVLPGFDTFSVVSHKDLLFVSMTEYEAGVPVDAVAFPPLVVANCLAQTIANTGFTQLHIAETEKYAHITFFLNGTVEKPFPKEDRKIIPSPHVSSYDKAPEMAAKHITKCVVEAIEQSKYDCIMLNFANGDMVGHTGEFAATVQAACIVDSCIGKIVDATLAKGGAALITADHGNAEELLNVQTGERDKEHSTNPVPFIIIGKQWEGTVGPAGDPPEGDMSLMEPVGVLADVAPTMLKIMGIPQPEEMTGSPLI